jgi:hypothetical protein
LDQQGRKVSKDRAVPTVHLVLQAHPALTGL